MFMVVPLTPASVQTWHIVDTLVPSPLWNLGDALKEFKPIKKTSS